MGKLTLLLACVLACGAPSSASAQAPADPVDYIVGRLTTTLNTGDRGGFSALFAATVPATHVQRYVGDLFMANALRMVVRERDRGPLEGAPPGDGFRMVVEIFIESAGRARIVTSGIDIRRPAGGALETWRIVGAEGLSSVDGLYKLRLNTARPLAAKNLEVLSEDLVLSLPEGTVFLVECDDGVTGVVMLGRGEMRFAPSPATERGQLRLYAGTDTLNAPFEHAFVRLNPSDYREFVNASGVTPTEAQPRLVRRAQEVFDRESTKSFNVDLQDLSRDAWSLLPPGDDFLAEVRTTRFDTLTYSRSSVQAEDVTLFSREERRTISLYPSIAKLAARGRFYSDDTLREFDVLDYSVDAAVAPDRQALDARARLSIRVRSTSLSTMMLRLSESLTVTGVTSVEYGRLLFLRLRSQNTLLINLPRPAPQDSDLTLVITYAGALTSQDLDIDTVQVTPDQEGRDPIGPSGIPLEGSLLLSNRSFWYPQNPVPDYATASLRIVVPTSHRVVGSGQPIPAGDSVTLRELALVPNGRAFAFRANQPLRYLAVIITRMQRVAEATVAMTELAPENADVDRIEVAVEAHRSLQGRGRALIKTVEDVLRFYAGVIGDAPYASATVALLESELPGGHSPGYFAVLNSPLATRNGPSWRGDPASFDNYPEFFIAHELAHQWWGQAIGWKNYHEQWISEGFAQYFAALYAQRVRGERTFVEMLRQFRRWSIEQSDQGPVHLGYRLGHLKADTRIFRALVYNKGAATLHMLRRLLGDELFFNGIRRFYADRRYQKAGTDDFERAMEAASGRTLDRFFERWIYGTAIPRVTYTSTTSDNEVAVRFEQQGDLVFDIPITVTLTYADGRSTDVMVPVTDRRVEWKIPTAGVVRQVQVNRDFAAVAEISGR